MLVKCTKSNELEIRCSRQTYDDPSDGTRAGWYAWVGPEDDQSDFAVGPFESREKAEDGAIARLKRMGYTVRRVER